MTRVPEHAEQAVPSPWAAPAPLPSEVLFEAVLEPHRSLKPGAFRTLMILILAQGVLRSVMFVLVGAWPLVGFMAIDVLLVWVAFRASYRHGRLYERVRLTRSELEVERVWPGGKRQNWTIEPYWARVVVENPGAHEVSATLVGRGQKVVLGAFLAPEQREAFADALKAALAKRPAARIG